MGAGIVARAKQRVRSSVTRMPRPAPGVRTRVAAIRDAGAVQRNDLIGFHREVIDTVVGKA